MNTTVVLALDTRRPRKDGTSPVLVRIIHFGESAGIRTGVYLKEIYWDAKERKVRGSYRGTESVAMLNNRLEKKKSEAVDFILKLEEQNKLNTLTVYEIKDLIEKKPQRHSFISYTEELIKELYEANRIGNARAYKSMLGAVKAFTQQKDVSFHQISPSFLKRFETAHLNKGNKLNGLAVYMRTIRSVYNQAIKAKIVDKELYPFSEYSIKTEKTRKRAIHTDHIKTIAALQLPHDHPLYHTRNYFLASFYLRGMPFVDLAMLTLSNIIDGRIHYERQKTGTLYDVKITKEVQAIFDLYTIGKKKDEFIFPIVKRVTTEDQYKDILWARGRFNKKLKRLAKLCGIEENLTSYVSRHSFATRAKNLGIPIASISDMLGHGDIKTTEVYLDGLPSDLLDDLHEKILG